jgi:hypothetical protein
MKLEDLKVGAWFRWSASGSKAKYLGEAKTDLFPEGKVFLYMHDNGQRYFSESGKRLVSKADGYCKAPNIRKKKMIDIKEYQEYRNYKNAANQNKEP